MIAGMYDQSIMNMIQKLKDEDEDSAVIADELYRIGRSMQDDYLMGIAVYGRARARLFDSLHLNAVMTDALEAVEHSKLAKNYDTLCRAYILLGIVSDIHINYPLAVAYYIDAAGIVPKTENPKLNGAIVNTNIAQIFAAVHEYEKAEYYNNMAIELMIGAEKTPAYVRDMASMLASSASYALEAENDIAEAEKKYSEAEKLRGREGWDEFSDMDQLLTRIRISAARHDDAEVMKYYHDFMAIQTSLPYTADCIEGVNYLLSYMIEHRQFEACKEIVAYVESRLDTEVPGVLMQVYDEEGQEKVFKHQKMREGKGFLTIEQSTDIHQAADKMEKDTTIENVGLLECMSNLVANEMFREGQIRDCDLVKKNIIDGIEELLKTVKDFIIVTNNVFEDGIVYDETTMNYIRTMGCINQELAKMADKVIEVVVGIPIIVKEGK